MAQPNNEEGNDTGQEQEAPEEPQEEYVGTEPDSSQEDQIGDIIGQFADDEDEQTQGESEDQGGQGRNEDQPEQEGVRESEVGETEGDEESVQEEESEEEEEPSEIEKLRNEFRELKEENAELRERIEGEDEGPEEEAPQEPEEEEEPRQDLSETQFVTDEEFEEVTQDPESFNEFLQAFGERLLSAAEENILHQIPSLVQKTTERQVSTQQTVQNFWESNPELKEYSSFVQHIANQVESEHPDATLQEQLEETARRAREELNIKEKAEEIERNRQEGNDDESQESSPSTAPKPRGRRGPADRGDDRSKQQQQIDELIT